MPSAGSKNRVSVHEVLRRELSQPQLEAVNDPSAAILCLACAGSGKSRTLAFRIARLLSEGAEPRSIVAFTFTEKAAESIKQRTAYALNALGMDPTILGAMYIGTIHAFCQMMLSSAQARYRQFDVLDDNRLSLFLMSRYASLEIKQLREAHRSGATLPKYFKTIKEVSGSWKTLNEEAVSTTEVSAHDPQLGRTLALLGQRLNEDEFIDFSLMTRLTVNLLEDGNAALERSIEHIAHLMVDEYQDINTVQEQLIRHLYERGETLFVVGDDDQAIYGWRGADVQNILTFEDRYRPAARHTLSQNFRSTEAIVSTADAFVVAELGPARLSKNPQAVRYDGPRHLGVHWFERTEDEATWVARRIRTLLGTRYEERDGTVRGLEPSDFAVLMRSVRGSRGQPPKHIPFTNALGSMDLGYTLEAGGGLFEREEIRLIGECFESLRDAPPSRERVENLFESRIRPLFPDAEFRLVVDVFTYWGRRIHTPEGGVRQRLYPQALYHELLEALGLPKGNVSEGVLLDLGVFSRILQDAETVYVSVDSGRRYGELLNFIANIAGTGYDPGDDELVRMPNLVTVSTVHRAKGLEFPVVFIVDAEAGRFPPSNRKYDGWMPREVIEAALARGSYASNPNEEARLFYTAMTRAERYLYVSGSKRLPGGKIDRKQSRYSLRLNHAELTADQDEEPRGLVPEPGVERVSERVLPTSFSDIRYYLKCPRDFWLRKICGFSPAITEMFGFGRSVHAIIGVLHEEYQRQAPTREQARDVADSTFHIKHIPPSRNPTSSPGGFERAKEAAGRIVGSYAQEFSGDFRRRREVEARFEIPSRQSVISGSIDLLLRMDEHDAILEAEVVDFKSMEGGVEPTTNPKLEWTELALQVQLYAAAANQVLGEQAATGGVHLLKDGQRIEVPIDATAVENALANVDWAVDRIIARDYPMRPSEEKCHACDFRRLCEKRPEEFKIEGRPPSLHLPGGDTAMAQAVAQRT